MFRLKTKRVSEWVSKRERERVECLVKNLLHNRKVTVYICSIFRVWVLYVLALNYKSHTHTHGNCVSFPHTAYSESFQFPEISWLTNSPKSTASASLSHRTVEQHSSLVDRSKQCGSKFCIFPRGTKAPWHLASHFHLASSWHMQRSSHPFSSTSPTCWRMQKGGNEKEFNYE